MPALLPPNSTIYEEGVNFIHGKVRKFMIEDSLDGYIAVGNYECEGEHQYQDMVLELKCPYPDESKVNVHYKIPVYYTTQLLCHMKAKEVKCTWYASYSKQSLVLLQLDMDEEVWDETYKILCQMYDKEVIEKPKNKVKHKEDLKPILQNYLDANTKVLVEVRSMEMDDNTSNREKGEGPYYVPAVPNVRKVSKSSIASKLKSICHTTCDLVKEAYELQRRKATKILAFVISDTDRIHDGEHPNQIPIAYALKGYSLSTDTLRKMADIIRNKCKDHGIDVLCEATDGQWAKNCVRMKDDLPLTKLQYQKDVWNTFAHNSKQTSYEILADYSKVAPRCLEELSGIVFPRQQKFEIGNLKVEYTKDDDGKKKFTLSSVGSLGHNIPMIQHIKTTTVPSAWQCNKSK